MRYLLWLPLRVVALILLPIITVFGFLRMLLRVIGGANQMSPSPAGCLVQFILLPVYLPVMVIYYVASILYLRIVALDVRFGFATPEEAQKLPGISIGEDEMER